MDKGRRTGKKFKCEKRRRSVATGKVGDGRRVGGTDLGRFLKKANGVGICKWSERGCEESGRVSSVVRKVEVNKNNEGG